MSRRAQLAHHPRITGAVVAVTGLAIALFLTVVHRPDRSVANPSSAPAGVFTSSGTQITDGANLPSSGFSPLTVRVPGTGARQVKFVLDSHYLGSDDAAPYSKDVAPPTIGKHRFRGTIQDAGGTSRVIDVAFSVVSGSSATTSGQSSLEPTNPATTTSPVTSSPVTTGPAGIQVVVTDAVSLEKVLGDARPGDHDHPEGRHVQRQGSQGSERDGTRPFRHHDVGTAAAPIVLQGSRNAILDGGGTGGGYALHLKAASYWELKGFTIQSASKGIVLDGASHTVIDGVHVRNIGDEGVHFRDFSSDNLLTNSIIDNAGVDSPNYGEGVYIGSAQSNWATYSGGKPDGSDRNQIIGNTITETVAEGIDIKEGSSSGIVRGNYLGGNKVASKNSADSWIDVKGNGYLVDSNHGVTAPRPMTTRCGDPKGDPHSTDNPFCDGFQVHVILSGWGQNNTFTSNVLDVNAPGAGIWLQNTAVPLNNVIRCNNTVIGAKAGAFATNHYSALACTP